MFTLEALQAHDGDCLLLHYGSKQDPKLILIDGGPTGIYKSVLKARLDQLRGTGTLDVRLAMVSHIDLDHIAGILDLFKHLYELQNSGFARCGTTASRNSRVPGRRPWRARWSGQR